MARTVWKVKLPRVGFNVGFTIVQVPAGARPVCAAVQFDDICVWYECDPRNLMEKRQIICVPTGGEIPVRATYVGTIPLDGGAIILHIYDQVF